MEFDNTLEVPRITEAWSVLLDIKRTPPASGAELTEVVDERTYKEGRGARRSGNAVARRAGATQEIDHSQARSRRVGPQRPRPHRFDDRSTEPSEGGCEY